MTHYSLQHLKVLLLNTTSRTEKRKSSTTDWMLNSMNAVEVNGDFVYASNNTGEIYILQREKKWKPAGKFKMKRGKIKDITISHDGKYLAAAGEHKTVVIWDLEANKVVKSMRGTVQQINDITFSRDGAEIIIAYNNGSVRLSNLISNQTVVNSMRPKSEILSTFSSYTIQRIESISYDTITFSSLYRMNSLVHDGVYDQVDKYDLTWDLIDNILTFSKSQKRRAD